MANATASITIAFCTAFLASSFANAETQSPPNIVLILSDDQGYTDYGFMGHPEIETPHLDKLAKESALFRRGYVPTALCRPSLMTLITGLYSHQNKTTGNDPANTPANKAHADEAGKDARELLISHIDRTGALPQWLAKKGYVSHQSGKWWEGSPQRAGFTEGMTKGFPNRGGRHGDAGLKIGREGIKPVTEFIDRSVADKKPFFVWYAPFMPHTPHTPPARLFEKYKAKGVHERIAKYYAMCEWFDETCGALMNHIDDAGIKENTLVLYVCDNGWVQTEKGSYAPRSKRSPNELGTRTPLMFRWPGTIPTIQQFFMDSGYRVASGGKVFHGNPGKVGDSLFAKPRDPKPPKGEDNFNAMRAPNDGYALIVADEEMSDYKIASWATEQWQTVTDKPLFMSVGFFRPHRPLQVPKPWFDKFPLASIRRPAEPDGGDDWADMPEFARRLARTHAHKPLHKGLSDHEYIVANDEWDATIRAYHASIAFVDRQIGRFVQQLTKNPRGRETYVILVSDHGWHLGEKQHWCKGAIWEQTTHIPFIVRGPGVQPGSKCTQPVSLIDVYPSLVDLAGLENPAWLDGTSIKPQLTEPSSPRPPAISSYGEGNTSIRTERWRYIRYEDGSEELYDHRVDPNEWTNLANQPAHEATKENLAKTIPKNQHPGLKVQSWFDNFQK